MKDEGESISNRCPEQYRVSEEKRKTELLEDLAALEHEQWRSWAMTILDTENISEARRVRWRESCFKPYSQLTEEQKDPDRVYAEKVLFVVKKHMGIR